MTDLSLSKGDRVVYPNQGLCTVTDIKTQEIAGHTTTWVSLQFADAGDTLKIVKVPIEKLVKNGVRRVSSADEVKKVVAYLKSDSEKASLDWKKRARDNTARLSEGGLLGLAEVVKGLQVLSELRPLPPKERGQYNDARHLFVEELAAALGIPMADAEDTLDIILFPVGKERPKRSIEEFKALAGEDDELLGDFGIEGDEAEPEEEAPAEESSEEEGEEAEEKPAAKKGAKAAKAPKAAPADEEAAPKKRGRPPKPKPEAVPGEPPPAPKKRGRPPKAKPAAEAPPAAPKKRGRPPKAK